MVFLFLADHQSDFLKRHDGKILIPEYDFYSVMHYKTTEFSRDYTRLKTIEVLQDGVNETIVGQREFLSDLDKQRVRILYECDKSRRTIFTPQSFREPSFSQSEPSVVIQDHPVETGNQALPGEAVYNTMNEGVQPVLDLPLLSGAEQSASRTPSPTSQRSSTVAQSNLHESPSSETSRRSTQDLFSQSTRILSPEQPSTRLFTSQRNIFDMHDQNDVLMPF